VVPEFIEANVDKFVFRVSRDCLYSEEGVWVHGDRDAVRVGVADFVQQSSGDVAFVEVAHAGTRLRAGDELCSLETVKVTNALPSPISGTVREVNADLEANPERVNEDPYGEGWIALIEPSDWERESGQLLDAETYAALMHGQAAEEMQQR
jgi:glycine cleavage system H protein